LRRRLATIAALLIAVAVQARAPAPGPDCLDARAIERAHAVDEHTLAIDAEGGWFVVAHSGGCALDGAGELLARDGWLCGADGEFVRSGERLCPIRSVTRIDGRTYAGLAAAAHQRTLGVDAAVTAPLEVQAPAPRRPGFRGDSSYCFSPVAVRGWHVDGRELVVQAAPRRNGGKRSDRVALDAPCPELTWADAVEFVSGVGVGMICGNPGDRVLPQEDAVTLGIDDRGPTRSMLRGCGIAAVWPEE